MRSYEWTISQFDWVSLKEEEMRTQTHKERRPCEDTGRK